MSRIPIHTADLALAPAMCEAARTAAAGRTALVAGGGRYVCFPGAPEADVRVWQAAIGGDGG